MAGCGGNGEARAPETFTGIAPEDPGPIHVHGLGVNSADGSLFIATHTGLYRTAPDEKKAKRVSDRYQDTMGFTIAGPDHFLRSGHPDARDLQTGTPPLLGLIESTDGGKTWKPISLLGKADFHVLRTVDDRVYGYDATNARLMVSSDRGQTWTERSPPGEVVDFAVEPGASGRLVLVAGKELYTSEDEGATWEPIRICLGLALLAHGDGAVRG